MRQKIIRVYKTVTLTLVMPFSMNTGGMDFAAPNKEYRIIPNVGAKCALDTLFQALYATSFYSPEVLGKCCPPNSINSVVEIFFSSYKIHQLSQMDQMYPTELVDILASEKWGPYKKEAIIGKRGYQEVPYFKLIKEIQRTVDMCENLEGYFKIKIHSKQTNNAKNDPKIVTRDEISLQVAANSKLSFEAQIANMFGTQQVGDYTIETFITSAPQVLIIDISVDVNKLLEKDQPLPFQGYLPFKSYLANKDDITYTLVSVVLFTRKYDGHYAALCKDKDNPVNWHYINDTPQTLTRIGSDAVIKFMQTGLFTGSDGITYFPKLLFYEQNKKIPRTSATVNQQPSSIAQELAHLNQQLNEFGNLIQ